MSLNDFVVDALERDRQYKGENFWTVDNHENYSTLDGENSRQTADHRINHQIFMLMCALNDQGVNDERLCSDPSGNSSLSSVIRDLSSRLAGLSCANRVHYVELGPEPIKTSRILDQITHVSDSIRYTAIDINETSRMTMHDAIGPILANRGSFNYIAADYRKVTHEALAHDQDVTFITMLGFQEGNELPVTTGRLIRTLSGRETYIISEMQVYDERLEDSIYTFYANPNMVRFSELVARQQGFAPLGAHQTTIVRFKLLDELIHVAVTLQPVAYRDRQGYLLTNICLKYTPDQFRRTRARHGNCTVVDELVSGDGSVRYQIARSIS